jgi:predicted PurR-regulated permease PerM
MSIHNKNQKIARSLLIKWFPIILTIVVIFMFPPVAFAVIAAYFTAPLLTAVQSLTRLPLTIATIFVILILFFLTGSFIYVGIHGIIELVPAVERHLTPLTLNTDMISKVLSFLESKIIQYGQAILEYILMIIQTLFQRLISFFIFLLAYFFALRESGKNRFWFLVYFPVEMRKQAEKSLSEASKVIGTFVSVEARLVFLTFIILSIGFSFLKFKSPFGIAFLISLVDGLPFLGIGIFLIPMIVFFIHTGNLFVGISLAFLYLLTITTRQFTESYMWASTFQLKPVHAFLIMACSIYLFGFVGILLSPFLLYAAYKVKQHPLFTE